MQKYLARRALFALGTFIGVSVIIFVVLRVIPGDPLVAILGVEGHAQMKPEDRVRIMADLGLSAPLPFALPHRDSSRLCFGLRAGLLVLCRLLVYPFLSSRKLGVVQRIQRF